MDEFTAYDAGHRLGIFHKCNGIEPLQEHEYADTSVNEAFFDAYLASYDANERKI